MTIFNIQRKIGQIRNVFLRSGKPVVFSLPIKKGSSLLEVKDRYLSDDFEKDARELLRQMQDAYKKAPNFKKTFMLFEKCLTYDNKNLFDFIHNSILIIKEYLEIKTKIIISSSIDLDSQPKIFISNFGVISEYEDKGIGSLLLRLVENYAIESKVSFIQLEFDCRPTNLIKFYNKNGFKKNICSFTEKKSIFYKDIRDVV